MDASPSAQARPHRAEVQCIAQVALPARARSRRLVRRRDRRAAGAAGGAARRRDPRCALRRHAHRSGCVLGVGERRPRG